MVDAPRKKSPRAPSIPLNEALERTLKVYDKERLHPAPIDIVAQDVGYKDAGSGRALSTLASLRYFGLMDRPKEGFLAVSKEVESYRFSPDENLTRSLLMGFLKRPPLFQELLEKYNSGLPSDANLRFELIQRGFSPVSAEATLSVFKRSIEFVSYYDNAANNGDSDSGSPALSGDDFSEESRTNQQPEPSSIATHNKPPLSNRPELEEAGLDRIPVRLPGGRRAWLLIPTPFMDADKARIKAQIDLILTKEEEDSLEIDSMS